MAAERERVAGFGRLEDGLRQAGEAHPRACRTRISAAINIPPFRLAKLRCLTPNACSEDRRADEAVHVLWTRSPRAWPPASVAGSLETDSLYPAPRRAARFATDPLIPPRSDDYLHKPGYERGSALGRPTTAPSSGHAESM